MPKSWDTGQQIPEKDRGWKFEVDLEEPMTHLGIPISVREEPTKWLRIKYDGQVAFEAKLEEFTVYMPWIVEFKKFFDNANRQLIAQEKFKEALQELGFKFQELVSGIGKDAGGQ